MCRLIRNSYWAHLAAIDSTKFASGTAPYEESITGDIIVRLDSGTSRSIILPPQIVNNIVSKTPGTISNSNGSYTITCRDFVNTPGTLDFTFECKATRVAYREFLFQISDDFCILGVIATTWHQLILGDTFSRSAFGMSANGHPFK